MRTVSPQVSSEQRRVEAAGCRRVRAEQRSRGSEACPWCPPSPIHPALRNLLLGLTIHRGDVTVHPPPAPETQQASRNRAFTLLPNHGVLVVPLETLSTPSPFLCLHSPLLVSIPSMTAVPPSPGSLQSTLLLAGRTSLIFTHPLLPVKCQPV